MSDEAEKGPTSSRGPAYPFIPLKKAMERVEQVHSEGLTRLEVSPISFYKSWGYKQENGASRQTMAALNHFGLVEYIGRGKDRKVKLSRLAQRIILDKMPDSVERPKAIKQAALNPAVYKELYEKFDGQLVPDHAFETFLTLELDFSEEAAQKVIAGYVDTFSYAEFNDSDTLPTIEPEDAPESELESNGVKYGGAKIGDLIQWEVKGVLQFSTPQRVRHIHDDGEWLFVDESETGIPMNEVIVEQSPTLPPQQATPPPVFPIHQSIAESVSEGETEWMRNKVGSESTIRILAKGEMGPKEIGKLIKLLEAQKSVLEDD